ncbi:MAG TPA: arylesterase [Gammaproteobacteria bacterium]
MRRLFLAAAAATALISTPALTRAEATIVVVGDSLSSGYGLAAEQSWVAMLDERLRTQGYEYEVVNASIAGDTSAGGLARLPKLIETYAPAWVIIELGGNDGLRGLPVQTLRDNLARMIELAQAHGAMVLLAGIRLPPNYGSAYTTALANVYAELAERYDVPLVPFLLEGVALDPSLMQADGIHPNAAGQPRMLENVWSVLEGLL